MLGLAAALTVANVVRLAAYARRDEIEIMQLVGAPFAYVRGPFIAEGVLQGGAGALAGLLLLWIGFAVAKAWWAACVRGARSRVADIFAGRAGARDPRGWDAAWLPRCDTSRRAAFAS